jgi:Leucine-rich repeat (LRR) protein
MSPVPEEFEPIPAQGPGPHFTINNLGRLAPAPPADLDAAGNNVNRIRQMLPLVRQAARDFAARLGSQSNTFPELARNAAQYLDEVSKPETEIEWGLLWGFGVVLEEAAAAADRAVVAPLEPPLEDSAQTALQGWRRLHPVLILATAEGSELQAQSEVNRMTKPERVEVREAARDLAQDVRADGLATDAANKILQAAVDAPIDGRHPERGVEFMVATVKNAAIVLVSAAVVAGVAHNIGGGAGIAVGMAGWELAKKSNGFSSALAALGKSVDDFHAGAGSFLQNGLEGLHLYWHFVKTRKTKFLRFSKSAGQNAWMDNFVHSLAEDKVTTPAQPRQALPAETIPDDFLEQAKAMIIAGEAPPIPWRKSISELDFARSNLYDLGPISDLTSLVTLDLDDTMVNDLSPLRELINLQLLALWGTQVTDLSPISNCRNIGFLSIGLGKATDWTPLQSLSNLEQLFLFGARIYDLSPIASLTKLSRLDISRTSIQDLSPIASLIKLADLDISGTSIRDLSPIGSLKKLSSLKISNTMVADLEPIQNLENLQELQLAHTPVKSVAPLRNMLSLRKLTLTGTRVEDASTLDHLRPKLKIIGGPKRKSAIRRKPATL